MIPRSPSRRRRASRSGGSSPQPIRAHIPHSNSVSPGRRASIAVSPVDSDSIQQQMLSQELMSRCPRHSIIPDISLEAQSVSSNEDYDIPLTHNPSPRNSLAPTALRIPRNSLTPGDYQRTRRSSTAPEGQYSRSPRNSLVPEVSKSPRHSLVPEVSKTPRHSLVPEDNSGLILDFNRSPRNSLYPDGTREPRSPRTNEDNWGPILTDDMINVNRSPRPSITPSCSRSPRGSIAYDRTTLRDSNTNEFADCSSRGSIGEWNHRELPDLTSIQKNGKIYGSNERIERIEKSPRGSLQLTFLDPPANHPRRYSTDYGQKMRSSSPYRSHRGAVNQGYNQSQACYDTGSRRASSSVLSQVSADEQKRLFSGKTYAEIEAGEAPGQLLTTYGSVTYQLKDANVEANNTCEFVCKALNIFKTTAFCVTLLVLIACVPLVMLILGAQFIRDCPKEPYIPIYMVVGGVVWCLQMVWIIWSTLYARRMTGTGAPNKSNICSIILWYAMLTFLIIWFGLGNYWILHVWYPDDKPTLFEPNRWCHPTLYSFGITHLVIVYSLIGLIVLIAIVLAICHLRGCPWLAPVAYK